MKYTISDAFTTKGADWRFVVMFIGIEWLDSSQTKPTEVQIINKISELNSAEAMRLLRLERNSSNAETDWRASSDFNNPSDAWKTYRQALNLPATASQRFT